MGLEKTAEQVKEDARAECAKILGQANSGADSLLEKARAEARTAADRMLLKWQDEARFAGEKIVADARLEADRKKMRLQSGLISKAIGTGLSELEKFSEGKGYPPVLERLALEAINDIGLGQVVLVVRKKDAKHLDIKKLSKEAGVHLEVAKHAISVPGAMVESPDGAVRVDNTFAARVKRDEGELRKVVSEALFGGVQ